MSKAWQLLVQARGDSRGGQRAMRDLQKAGRRLSSAIGIDFKNIARMGALALGAGLAATVKVGYDELKESAAVTAQTVAGLKSTSRAANVTKKGILDLASAISNKTGIDDEAVQAGENLLLTFTNIKNAAGKNNDIFSQTTRAISDVATKMNNGFVPSSEQMQKTSIQLGKALNDPIKGVGALSKIGVSFTQGQKDQIKAMVEAGDTMGAQKLILAELNKEFGGAAVAAGKTGPGAIARAKNAFAELAAMLTNSVGPSMAHAAEKALEVIKSVQAWAQTASGKKALAEARDILQAFGTVIGKSLKLIGSIAKKMYEWRNVLIPLAAGILAAWAAFKGYTILMAVIGAVKALNLAIAANPIGFLILAIVGLVAALVVLYKRSETFRNIVNGAFSAVKKVAIGAMKALVAAVKGTIKWLRSNWKLVLAILTGPIGLAVYAIAKHWKSIRQGFTDLVGYIKGIPGKITSAASGMFDGIRNAFRDAINWIIDKWNALELSLSLPKKLGGGSIGIGTPNIPHFARGGITNKPGIFGDDGWEAAVPLGNSSRATRDRERVMRQAGLMGAGGIHINITAGQSVLNDPHALAARLSWALRSRGLAGRMA